MFVSPRSGTFVEVLACPSPRGRRFANLPPPLFLALRMPLRGLIEKSQALARAQGLGHLSGGQDAEGVARGHPLDLVPGPDAELIGERLGKGHLKLRSHLGHDPYCSKDTILTLT